ncbi:MAG TPA: hypothetical protein PLJ78_13810 [Anaerolineae bacterium]|nr:hypothetical protein [Anaerolineae bacterium]HQK15006.1 hypothetical protein [Anaerolineae bacterium]
MKDHCLLWPVLILGTLLFAHACAPTASFLAAPTSTPNIALTPTPLLPTATSTSTPLPTPTATATPIPTPDATIARNIAREGMAAIQARAGDAALLCLRYEDTDADGAPEWVALFHQETNPPRLSAFVLDGEAVYPLEPAFPKAGAPDVGLGQYATCEVEIRDINADGRPEIAIFGHADKNKTLLHLYVWEAGAYRRLGAFSGDAGVRFMDTDGDLEEEIWEGYREQGAPDLAWYVIHTWEEHTYGWTSDRWGWYALDRPHPYPTHKPEYAVIAFYLALNDRDLPGAYHLLLPQDERPYETWAHGFATTVRVSVGSVHTIPGTETESSARVAAMVTSWDNEGGVIVGRLWNTEWHVSRTPEGWRLVNATAEMLEEWTATYWP